MTIVLLPGDQAVYSAKCANDAPNYELSFMSNTTRIWAILALTATALIWSGNFIVGRLIGGVIPPLELNMMRWLLCLALLLPFTARGLVQQWALLRSIWVQVVLLGLTGIAAFHAITYHALSLTEAVNCLLILALAPIATVIGGAIWNGFRPSWAQIAGLVVSIIGAIYLVLQGSGGTASILSVDAGKLWMMAGILIWAWYTLLLRKRPAELRQDVLLAASVIVAIIAMAGTLAIKGVASFDLTLPAIGAIAYIGIFASLCGFLFWSYGVSVIGPEIGGQFVHLMPVFGSILAVIVLGETIVPAHLIGAGCIVAGLILVNQKHG